MAVVIDASIAIAWCVRDRPGTPDADLAIEQGESEGALVPDLFWHEVRSALLVAERRGRIGVGTTEAHLKVLRGLSPQTDGDHGDNEVTALARDHALSGYDAAYVETAKRRRARLATLDKELAAAAAREGVVERWSG